jgi:DNA-binding MarR family transcriptional regulator
MKDILIHINKAFENRIRLGIMSILMVNETVDYNALKNMLDVTDGNLASHINVLEKFRYVKSKKRFIGRKPNTSYYATESGKKEFSEHLDALEKLIRNSS